MNASSHFSILTVILTLLFMSHPLRASKAPADSTFLFYISGDTRIEGQPLSTLYGVYNVVEHLESVFSIENNPQAARYHAVILFDGYHPNDYPTLSVFKYGKKLKEHSIDYVLDSGKPLSLDMGHPETFRVFLNKIKNANLVSRYYHLGFNGHGAGWQGYGFDTNDGRLTPRWTQDSVDIIKENQEDLRKIEGLIPPSATKEQIQEISERVFQERREARKKLRDAHRPSYLSVKELSETLSAFLSSPLPNGNPRFDVIHFTACIMESIELAYEFSDFANAMSGSSLSTPFAGPDIISELAESKNFGETLKDLIWGRKYFLQYEQKYDFLRRDHSYTPSEILEELLHSVIYLQAQDPSSVNVTWKPYPSGDTRDLDELYVQNSEVYSSLIASMEYGNPSPYRVNSANAFWIALHPFDGIEKNATLQGLIPMFPKFSEKLTQYVQKTKQELYHLAALEGEQDDNLVELRKLVHFLRSNPEATSMMGAEFLEKFWNLLDQSIHAISPEVATLSIRIPSMEFLSGNIEGRVFSSYQQKLTLADIQREFGREDINEGNIDQYREMIQTRTQVFQDISDETPQYDEVLSDHGMLKFSSPELGWTSFLDTYTHIMQSLKKREKNSSYGDFFNDEI